MKSKIDIFKGIHPGKIIDRELKKRNLSQRVFAAFIGEHSQTLNAIIAGRRKMTMEMALKIEKAFNLDEGFLLTLQIHYEIAEYKKRLAKEAVSGVPHIRHCLFWDTDFEKIDWGGYKTSVINRVLERGNDEEIAEIARFYQTDIEDIRKYQRTNTYYIRQRHESTEPSTTL